MINFNKNKTMKVLILEVGLFALIVFGLLFLTPKINGVDNQDRITFFKFANAHAILVDDNPDFSSPEQINEGAVKLKPGEYYWKAIGVLGESKVGIFSIDSEVIISMNITSNRTFIINKGNVPVNLTQKKDGVISGNMIIDVNSQEEFSNDIEEFEARQQ